MAVETITVGQVEILAVSDCTMEIDVCNFFPNKSFTDMDPYRHYLDEDCNVKGGINVGAFLISTKRRRILVDAGLGPGPWESLGRNVRGNLPGELSRRNIDPSNIDAVIVTHMHFDHIGWLVTESDGVLRRTFPKAQLLIPKADWDLLLSSEKVKSPPAPDHFSTNALTLFAGSSTLGKNIERMGNFELVSGEHNVTDEITIVPTPGHTPGHQSVLITSAGQRAFVMGDVAHLPMQLHVPDWVAQADVQPELAKKTRAETLDWLEREGLLVASGHFPAPGFGRVIRGEARRYWKPL